MKDTLKQKKRFVFILIIYVAIILTFFIVGFAKFVLDGRKNTDNITKNEIVNSKQTVADFVDANFTRNIDMLNFLVNKIASIDYNDEEAKKILNEFFLSKSDDYKYFLVSHIDTSHENSVKIVSNSDEYTNTGYKDNFLTAVNSDKIIISEPLSDFISGDNSKIIHISLPFAKKGETEKSAIASVVLDVNALSAYVPKTKFEIDIVNYSYIINSEGIVISDKDLANSNILQKMKDKGNENMKPLLDEIAIALGERKSFYSGANENGTNYSICVTPISTNGWHLLSFVSQDLSVMRNSILMWNSVHFIIILLLSLFCIFSLVILFLYNGNKTLKKKKQFYGDLILHLPMAVLKYNIAMRSRDDYDFQLLFCNNRAEDMLMCSENDYRNKYNASLANLTDEEHKKKLLDFLFTLHESNYKLENGIEIPIYMNDTKKWLRIQFQHIVEDSRYITLYIGMIDITINKDLEKKLSLTEERFYILTTQIDETVFEYNFADRTFFCTDNWTNRFGTKPSDSKFLDGITDMQLVHPDDLEIFGQAVYNIKNKSGKHSFQVRLNTIDKGYIWYEISCATILNLNSGAIQKILGQIVDISLQKNEMANLEKKAQLDLLTGLKNKITTALLISDYLDGENKGTFIIFDIDNFKTVNDTMGHLAGDILLQDIAKKLKYLFRTSDIIGRIGGDEFIVYMVGNSSIEAINSKTAEIRELVQNSLSLDSDGNPIITASIGVSISPKDGTNFTELYKKADAAMYNSKRTGKNKTSYYGAETELPKTATATKIDDVLLRSSEDNLFKIVLDILHDSKDFTLSLQLILEYFGQKLNASRVCIFENDLDNKFMCNTFEWINTNTSSQKASMCNISLQTSPNFYDLFDNESSMLVLNDTSQLPDNLKDAYFRNDTISTVNCDFKENGIRRGFINIEDCNTTRAWSTDELTAISNIANIIGLFLLGCRFKERSERKQAITAEIFKSQKISVYTIEPTTYKIFYTNEYAKTQIGEDTYGRLCYDVIRHKDAPCDDCPMKGTTNSSSCFAPQTVTINNKTVNLFAKKLKHLDGTALCVVSCTEVKGYDGNSGSDVEDSDTASSTPTLTDEKSSKPKSKKSAGKDEKSSEKPTKDSKSTEKSTKEIKPMERKTAGKDEKSSEKPSKDSKSTEKSTKEIKPTERKTAGKDEKSSEKSSKPKSKKSAGKDEKSSEKPTEKETEITSSDKKK